MRLQGYKYWPSWILLIAAYTPVLRATINDPTRRSPYWSMRSSFVCQIFCVPFQRSISISKPVPAISGCSLPTGLTRLSVLGTYLSIYPKLYFRGWNTRHIHKKERILVRCLISRLRWTKYQLCACWTWFVVICHACIPDVLGNKCCTGC